LDLFENVTDFSSWNAIYFHIIWQCHYSEKTLASCAHLTRLLSFFFVLCTSTVTKQSMFPILSLHLCVCLLVG